MTTAIQRRDMSLTHLLDDIFGLDSALKLDFYDNRTFVKQTEKQYEISVAMPGISKENIDVYVENNILHIKSEETNEFTTSSFHKSWSLPHNVNEEDIKASYKDGILYATIPKIKSEKIQIALE